MDFNYHPSNSGNRERYTRFFEKFSSACEPNEKGLPNVGQILCQLDNLTDWTVEELKKGTMAVHGQNELFRKVLDTTLKSDGCDINDNEKSYFEEYEDKEWEDERSINVNVSASKNQSAPSGTGNKEDTSSKWNFAEAVTHYIHVWTRSLPWWLAGPIRHYLGTAFLTGSMTTVYYYWNTFMDMFVQFSSTILSSSGLQHNQRPVV